MVKKTMEDANLATLKLELVFFIGYSYFFLAFVKILKLL